MVDMMRMLEIPRESWVDRLNAFTRAYEGWLVTLDVFGGEIGRRHHITNKPLIGVSADRAEQGRSVAVSVGRSVDDHFTHIIDRVTHIYARERFDGASAALVIESMDTTETVLLVRSAVETGAAQRANSKAGR
jgi:uncharacterized protein DUF5335